MNDEINDLDYPEINKGDKLKALRDYYESKQVVLSKGKAYTVTDVNIDKGRFSVDNESNLDCYFPIASYNLYFEFVNENEADRKDGAVEGPPPKK